MVTKIFSGYFSFLSTRKILLLVVFLLWFLLRFYFLLELDFVDKFLYESRFHLLLARFGFDENFAFFYILLFFIDFFNISIIFTFCLLVFGFCIALTTTFLYAVSYWSIYSFLMFPDMIVLLLAFLISFFLIYLSESKWVFIFVSILLLVVGYISLALFFSVLIILFFIMFMMKRYNHFLLLLLVAVVCLTLLYRGYDNFLNRFRMEFPLFFDIGVINDVNELRGALIRFLPISLTKFVENKYFYIFKISLINNLNAFNPFNFFTQQHLIAGFSFREPVFCVLFLPFLYGIKNKIFRSEKKYFVFMILVFSIYFAVFPISFRKFDVIDLFILSPFWYLMVAFGLNILFERKKILFVVISFLFVFQFLFYFWDTSKMEDLRYGKTYGYENIR